LYGFHNDLVAAGRAKVEIDMKSHDLGSYQVVYLGSDYVVIRPLLRNGRSAISDITVKWNYSKQSFEVLQAGN